MRGYIRHPADIPIEFQRDMQSPDQHETLANVSLGGLAFHSHVALDVGAVIRVRIPLRQPAYETRARVAWCRSIDPIDHVYDIGVELIDPENGFRSRMVEQICHIEHYKREVLRNEGRELSGEEAALEWISKFADRFPGGDDTAPSGQTDKH